MFQRLALLCLGLAFLVPAAFAQKEISWQTLQQVNYSKNGGQYVLKFGKDVEKLNGQVVKLQGFMMPLDQATKQQNFILSANPVTSCFYCLPGGPESMVEVKAEKGIEFSYSPITLTGKLELLKNDASGMYYRLSGARVLN